MQANDNKERYDLIDEISQAEIYEGLLGYGMFSEKLPPLFSSKAYYTYCLAQTPAFQDKPRPHVFYESMRNTNVPRQLGIPDPRAYQLLCKCISDNWIDIQAYIRQKTNGQNHIISRIHFRKIAGTKALFKMNYSNWKYDGTPEPDLLIGSKYIVHADISTCFPSIYTHSIPWALVGKDYAKTHRGKTEWFNQIDHCTQNCKYGETHGVLIGPHVSNLLGEIILTNVDNELSADWSYIRNIDDYTCFVKTREDAQLFLVALSAELRKYDLTLNHKKTEIAELPMAMTEQWIRQVGNPLVFCRDGIMDYIGARAYLDSAIEVMQKNKENSAILNYAIKTLPVDKLSSNAIGYCIKTIFHLSLLYPYLLQIIDQAVFERFVEKKAADGIHATAEELSKLKPMPFIAMVASVGSNDPADMYNYLGGVKNDKRSDDLDAMFKEEKSNFHIVIVVDMWITGFSVDTLTYMYNDKPLKKHMLIQTISRVNRLYAGKEYGLIVDYIGIRDNMREAMKIYGGDNSVAPTADDVEQATGVFREELSILKDLFAGYDLMPFLDPNRDPAERYMILAKAAEYVFISTQELQSESGSGKSVQKVSFKTYFLKTVKRMRAAYDICQPSGELGEDESALAQCFMAIAGFVRKMSGTSEVDTDTMNRRVAKMVEEALKYNKVESVLEDGEQEDIFSPEYFEKLSDVKMPASKLELLVKMLRKQIKEYGKTNQMAAKRFQEMLEETIKQYHERRKHLTAEEAGAAQEQTSEEIIRNATEQALRILKEMNADRESFRKVGLTFEEKAFYDILMALRDQYNFEYGEDRVIGGVIVNDKCKSLAKKIKGIIDTKSSFADWLNNQIIRDQLKFDIKVCLIKNGYPPQYSPEVFRKVMEQVENFEENSDYTFHSSETTAGDAITEKSAVVYDISPAPVLKVAERTTEYRKKKEP